MSTDTQIEAADAMRRHQERQRENLERRRERTARRLNKYGRPAILALWRVLVAVGQLTCWIIIPIAALAFAETFTKGLDMNTEYGMLAAVATYVVAAVAGIKGAGHASTSVGTFKNTKFI